jgi:hypothetical protein
MNHLSLAAKGQRAEYSTATLCAQNDINYESKTEIKSVQKARKKPLFLRRKHFFNIANERWLVKFAVLLALFSFKIAADKKHVLGAYAHSNSLPL